MTVTKPALPKPCSRCPWRTDNHGKRTPDGWYTQANLRRLWSGLRRGERMSCHPTDPENPVSVAMQATGVRPAPAGTATHECTGAVILVQREYMRFQAIAEESGANALRHYRATHPRGLTKQGLAAVVQRLIFGGSPLDGTPMSRPNLNEAVSHPDLTTWSPEETHS